MTADATRLRDGLASWAERVQVQAVAAVPDLVRPSAPIETGQLRESITSGTVSSDGRRFTGTVLAPVIQAKTTDQGSPRHPIPVSGNTLLRFYWPNGPQGARVYHFMHVDHPGNQAQHWWEPALRMAWAEALLSAAVGNPLTGS